jgi:Tfp pilus assembly protein PilO
MNKLTKEKRNQLVLTVVIILLIAMGLYSGLIRYQQATLRNLDLEHQKANKKLTQMDEISKSGSKVDAELAGVTKELADRENEMASGDLYASMINSIRDFNKPYPVEIKQFASKGSSEMNLFTKYPYQQFTVSVTGTAYYHDIGKFIADFENHFRSSRILNLDLLPDNSKEKEKLTFKMDIVSLIKPTELPVKK